MRFDWIWDQKLSNTVLMYLRTQKDFLFEIKKTKSEQKQKTEKPIIQWLKQELKIICKEKYISRISQIKTMNKSKLLTSSWTKLSHLTSYSTITCWHNN